MISRNFLDHFRIAEEKEDFQSAARAVENGIIFRGTNLWILIFAIFIASLGLNVNSNAVIIGAMLISPLMGPIIGIGLSVGINDLLLLKKAVSNLSLAVVVALATSTLYFLISPLNEAHSELLARTYPTIYDVFIALFGGFAGTLAIFSKNKGNVIPGAAIATALMPPLCTAGYGVATWQWNFFLGAFYLFIINTVFIASATLFTVRLLKFPYKHLLDPAAETRTRRVITAIILLTLVPSIYFGYDIVQQDRFRQDANRFIERESTLPNDYLLNKKIDAKEKKILLVYGGKEISVNEIESLKRKLPYYDLENAQLEVNQGFAYLNEETKNAIDPKLAEMGAALNAKEAEIRQLKCELDSLSANKVKSEELFAELKAQYPALKSIRYSATAAFVQNAQMQNHSPLVSIEFTNRLSTQEKAKIRNWLKVKLKKENTIVIFE